MSSPQYVCISYSTLVYWIKRIFGWVGPCVRRKKVIVVENDYDDAVWWSEIKVNCVVPMILYIWIVVLFASSAVC